MSSRSLATRVVLTIGTAGALTATFIVLAAYGQGSGTVIAGMLIATALLGFSLRGREGSKDIGVGVLAGGAVALLILIVGFVMFLFWMGEHTF